MLFEKVTIEKTKSGSEIKFGFSDKHHTDASVHDSEYIGKKLGWFGYGNLGLMSTTLNHRKIIDEIDFVIETTPEQIKTARVQIEDSGGDVDKNSDLDIAIMDFQMRSMIAEKAMEIDDPWNPSQILRGVGKIAVDYPEFDLF